MTVGDVPGAMMAEADLDKDRTAFLEALDGGNLDRIRGAARRLLNHAASPARAAKLVRGSIEKNPPVGLRPFRIALLSSFSIELLENPLVAHAYTEGLAVNVYKPGFNQYQQQILNPAAGLYEFEPDLIIVAVDGSHWAPDLYGTFLSARRAEVFSLVDDAVSKWNSLLGELRRHTTTPVLLHSLPYPRYPALGVLDVTHEHGQRWAIARINEKLAATSRELGGVYLVDVDTLTQLVGHDAWYDPRLDFFARSPIGRSAMDALARVYLRYVRAISGFTRKCVVIDLDNSLWGGILGEVGPRGIALGSEYPGNAYAAFQHALLALRDRGVLLAIASKNNEEEVDRVFAENPAMVLKRDHFSARQIHWGPKSLSIARIAESLNLSLRHVVFVDDNPAECAEVELAHPSVTTIELPAQPERFVHALLGEGFFDSLSLSVEDTRRATLYEQREAAERLRADLGSMEDFYRSLDMRIYLEHVNAHNVGRASQMTQKTTQFNATTRRYTEADLNARIKGEAWAMLAMRLVDRFGDNGIVGLLLAERCGDIYDIDTLLMSCRVINRGAETCMLHWLAAKANAGGLAALEGWIFPTARNAPVREVYQRHGFAAIERTEEGTKWRLDLTTHSVDAPSWLRIIDETDG